MNTQKPEKKSNILADRLEIHSIFYSIQGEGPRSGEPALFVRLAGCNLQCPACDTDYTSKRRFMSSGEILGEYHKLDASPRLLIITGGEPFRQNITPLANLFLCHAIAVQVETNGTLAPSPNFPTDAEIVCSPKTKIHPEILRRANFWKYVLSHNMIDPTDGLPTQTISGKRPQRPATHYDALCKIYVQPADAQNSATNTKNAIAAARVAMKYGYRLSLQIHKKLNLQ